ncbi:30S ribosomal protein S18 [bacterium]|nr:30S ribosomal protein S18 [bacterium]
MVMARSTTQRRRRALQKRRVCRFCADTTIVIDYKESKLLSQFITERGKIIPRRISGNCAKHQREMTLAIKRARQVALLPFVSSTLSG